MNIRTLSPFNMLGMLHIAEKTSHRGIDVAETGQHHKMSRGKVLWNAHARKVDMDVEIDLVNFLLW